MPGTENAGAVFIFQERTVLNTFLFSDSELPLRYIQKNVLRAPFSALRNSFCKNMKAKNAGSTQLWLDKCGSSIIFLAEAVSEHFFILARAEINETEPASGDPTEVLSITSITPHYIGITDFSPILRGLRVL